MRHARLSALLLVVFGAALGRLSAALPAWAQDGAPPAVAASPDGPSEANPTRAVLSVPEGQPRYLQALRDELSAMGISGAACEADDGERAHCRLTQRGEESGHTYEISLAYSDVTDTVYAYISRYLIVPNDGAHSDVVLRRLMELNWTMLLGKFEWDPSDGEVRLALVLNTDSNFNRRAFRSAIRALGALGDRYDAELHRLLSTGR